MAAMHLLAVVDDCPDAIGLLACLVNVITIQWQDVACAQVGPVELGTEPLIGNNRAEHKQHAVHRGVLHEANPIDLEILPVTLLVHLIGE